MDYSECLRGASPKMCSRRVAGRPLREIEAFAEGTDGEAGPRGGGQQGHAAVDAAGDVRTGGPQDYGDLLVQAAGHDQAKDLQFTAGQATQIRSRGDQDDAAEVVDVLAATVQDADPHECAGRPVSRAGVE